MKKKPFLRPRTASRRRAVQALYLWDINYTSALEIESILIKDYDQGYQEAVQDLPGHIQQLSEDITPEQEDALEYLEPIQMDVNYYKTLVSQTILNVETLDQSLVPYLEKRLMNDLDTVEKAILRLGAYELHYRHENPYKVILNEAIELAKIFGSQDSHKYINGVLDKLAYKVRAEERK